MHTLDFLTSRNISSFRMLELIDAEHKRRSELKSRLACEGKTSLLTHPGHVFNDLLKPARYKVLYGGRGAAKSWAVAEHLIRKSAEFNPRILCTREYQNSIADSVHRLLRDTIDKLEFNDLFTVTKTSIKSKYTDGEFLFKGLHDNVQEIKSTEGVTDVWVEEAQSVSKESWEVLVPTIRTDGSEFIITLNPDQESDATFKRFITNTPPDSIIHHVNFDSNPYFPEVLEKERQYYLKLISDADNDDDRESAQSDYDHVWLGMTKTISKEVIFAGKFVVESFPDDLWKKAQRLLFGADFGFSQDPSTLIRMFIIDSTLYIEFEAYGVGVDFHGNMVANKGELEQFYDSVPLSKNWPIKGDQSRPETISFIRGLGFNMTAADKWPGCVEDGITHIKGFKKVVIHPRCKHALNEFKSYKFKVDRITGDVLPIIIDKNNHCIDAIRYGLDGYIQRRGDLGIWARLGAK